MYKEFSLKAGKKSPNKLNRFMSNHKIISAIIIILIVILILAIVGFSYLYSKKALITKATPVSASAKKSTSSDDDISGDLKGLKPGNIKEAEGEIFGDKNVFNIMLIGSDERSKEFQTFARGDTCMVMSINKETGKVKLVSFERGTGVKILDGQYKGQYDWLTHTFEYGGADLLMREVRENYKIDVTHYIRTNIYTFMQLVDSVGGVDVTLTKEEANYINNPTGTYGQWHIAEMHVEDQIQQVHEGANHLNGATAMLYSRCRWIDSDWQRVERQRNVVKSAASNIKKLNPIELNDFFNKVLPLIQTNLSDKDMLNLLTMIPKYSGIDDKSMTMPVKGTYSSMVGMEGRQMFATDFQKNSEILKEFLYGKS